MDRSSFDGVAIRYSSGFVDDVMFSRNGNMARHAYSSAAIEHDKHNSRDSKQFCWAIKIRSRPNDMDCAPGAKSAVYN